MEVGELQQEASALRAEDGDHLDPSLWALHTLLITGLHDPAQFLVLDEPRDLNQSHFLGPLPHLVL